MLSESSVVDWVSRIEVSPSSETISTTPPISRYSSSLPWASATPANAQEGSSTGVDGVNVYIPSGISREKSSVEKVSAAAVKGRESTSASARSAAVHLVCFTITSVLYVFSSLWGKPPNAGL